jgi:hypothetical protein
MLCEDGAALVRRAQRALAGLLIEPGQGGRGGRA